MYSAKLHSQTLGTLNGSFSLTVNTDNLGEIIMLRTRVIVAGSRTFNDFGLLTRELTDIFRSEGLEPWDVEIISGGAEGTDSLAEKFAKLRIAFGQNIKLTVMRADWRRGYSAGYIRNKEMALYAKANCNGICICFWDGQSRGTKHMIDLARKEGLDVHIVMTGD